MSENERIVEAHNAGPSGEDQNTIYIQVRRSQRKGKKKVDPDFIGTEKGLVDCENATVILTTLEKFPEGIKNEEVGEEVTTIIAEGGDEWEALTKHEYSEFTVVPHPEGRYECNDCQKSFHHKNDLVRHMNIHNGSKPYVCETCGKKFLRSDYLRLHVIKHQGVKPLKCELCERRFYDRSNLRQHMRTHTGEKPAMCPYCPHRCSQLSDMRKHLTIHTKEKAFQCDTCGKTFSLKTGLVQHQRLHTGERPFACEFCPKRFRDHTSMRRHRRIHTGDKPFLCTHCGKTFTQVANMKRHMLVHQSDNKGRLYPCPFCGIELASKSDVRSHVAKEHEQKHKDGLQAPVAIEEADESQMKGEGDRSEGDASGETDDVPAKDEREPAGREADVPDVSHVCNLCGKVFPLDASLQEHVRTHLAAKEHQCETCGKTFCQASSLKQHQLVHSGLKPYPCHICGVSFRKTHHLRRHFLVHTGERPYQCEFCEKTFTSSGNLNKHRAIHLGEKNFECEFCSKKFTQSSNLSKHRSVHLRQQKQLTAGESADPNGLVAQSATKKNRGRKKVSAAASEPEISEEAFELISDPLADDQIRQDEEGHAVLHIVGSSGEHQDPDGQEVSYVTLTDGDIIIEI